MIMFWNQKEVFMGYSMKAFNQVRDVLSANNIKYKYKIVDSTGSRRARMGSFSERREYEKMYYIYVNKKEYDTVSFILSKLN